MIRIKSVREKKRDGEIDILITRLGEKIKDNYDYWLPDAGPVTKLLGAHLGWPGYEKITWDEFVPRYRAQILDNPDSQNVMTQIVEFTENHDIVLTCYCADEEHCHRILLKEILESTLKEKLEKEIALIQTRIKRTLSLPIDNLGEPSGAPTDPNMYPPIKLRKIRPEDLIPKPLKRIYQEGASLFDTWPQWIMDHYQGMLEIKDQYPDLVKNGECDIPDCACHWVANQKKNLK